MAPNLQVGDFLPIPVAERMVARSVFNTTAGNDTLALEHGVGGVIAKRAAFRA